MLNAYRICSLITILLATATHAFANESVTIRSGESRKNLTGRTLLELDGGLLFETIDQKILTIEAEDLLGHESDEQEFQPLDREQLKFALLADLPAGFQIYDTPHYVIAYNTSKAYAKWCGALYERLYGAFHNYWRRRGIELKPTPPLTAVVFQDRPSFEEYGRVEMDDAVKAVIGYYSLTTNRIATYDLTGVDRIRGNSRSLGSIRKINQALLSNPEAERTVATVIHEATHQLVFNTRMQRRFADIPVWLSEGLAIYFETPDLRRARGWSTIGAVNQVRLAQFRKYLPNRTPGSLKSLIVDNGRFRDTRTAESAYAEAWALCYVLLKKKPKQFDEYMRQLQKKESGYQDSPETRLSEFEAAFGPLEKIDPFFLKSISNLR